MITTTAVPTPRVPHRAPVGGGRWRRVFRGEGLSARRPGDSTRPATGSGVIADLHDAHQQIVRRAATASWFLLEQRGEQLLDCCRHGGLEMRRWRSLVVEDG